VDTSATTAGETATGDTAVVETILITELLAANEQGLVDEDGDSSDWIELHNPTDSEVSLAGWGLSNEADGDAAWLFPELSLAAGDYLVVFASGEDRRPSDGGELHTDFKLSADGEALVLLDPEGRLQPSSSFAPSYPEMLPDVSWGPDDAGASMYWMEPTPGAANQGERYEALASHATFSTPGGTFTEAFELTLALEEGEGSIRYTLDGSEPTDVHGFGYQGPVTLDATTWVQVKVIQDDRVPRPPESQVYAALDRELAAFDSNLPLVVVDSQGYDFSHDDSHSGSYPYQRCLAVILDGGDRTDLQGDGAFTGQVGMHVRGASSAGFDKKSFKLEVRGEDDEDLDVALLDMPADADWILHGPYFDKTLMRNKLVYDWWGSLGYATPRSRYVELFLRSDDGPIDAMDYQGVYLLMETIDRGEQRVDVTELEREDDAEPAITGGYIVQSTNINPHFVLETGIYLEHVYPKQTEITAEQARWIEGYLDDFEAVLFSAGFDDPDSGYDAWIDLDSHLDYDILRELSRNIDGASTYMVLDRGGELEMGPLWDYNQSLGMTSLFPASVSYAGEDGWSTEGWNNAYMDANFNTHWLKWWARLEQDPAYQARWEDRWRELRAGPLTTERLLADIDETATLLDEAQARNYERWPVLGTSVWITSGSPREAPGWDERDSWEKEVAWMRDWLEARLEWIDGEVPEG
jgi:hypothetical protein